MLYLLIFNQLSSSYVWISRDIDPVISEFWNEKVPFTPESRIETHEFMELQEKARNNKSDDDSWVDFSRLFFTFFFLDNGST